MDRDYNIRIEPQEYERLEEESQRLHRDVSEIANDVIKRHNFAVRVEQMRAKLVPLAQKAGYNSDEDIFREVSNKTSGDTIAQFLEHPVIVPDIKAPSREELYRDR